MGLIDIIRNNSSTVAEHIYNSNNTRILSSYFESKGYLYDTENFTPNSERLLGIHDTNSWIYPNSEGLENLGLHHHKYADYVKANAEPMVTGIDGAGFFSGAGLYWGLKSMFWGFSNWNTTGTCTLFGKTLNKRKTARVTAIAGASVAGTGALTTGITISNLIKKYESTTMSLKANISAVKELSLFGGSFLGSFGGSLIIDAIWDVIKGYKSKNAEQKDYYVNAGLKGISGIGFCIGSGFLSSAATSTWYTADAAATTIYTYGVSTALSSVSTGLLTAGILGVGALVGLGIYKLYKWKKNRRGTPTVIPTRGTSQGQPNRPPSTQPAAVAQPSPTANTPQGPPQGPPSTQPTTANTPQGQPAAVAQPSPTANTPQGQPNRPPSTQPSPTANTPQGPPSHETTRRELYATGIKSLITEDEGESVSCGTTTFIYKNPHTNDYGFSFEFDNSEYTVTKQKILGVFKKNRDRDRLNDEEQLLLSAFYMSYDYNNFEQYRKFLESLHSDISDNNNDYEKLWTNLTFGFDPSSNEIYVNAPIVELLGTFDGLEPLLDVSNEQTSGLLEDDGLWDEIDNIELQIDRFDLFKYLLTRKTVENEKSKLGTNFSEDDVITYFVEDNIEFFNSTNERKGLLKNIFDNADSAHKVKLRKISKYSLLADPTNFDEIIKAIKG